MCLSKNVVIFDSLQIPLLAANTQVMITVKLIQIFLKHLKEKIFSLSAVDWSDGWPHLDNDDTLVTTPVQSCAQVTPCTALSLCPSSHTCCSAHAQLSLSNLRPGSSSINDNYDDDERIFSSETMTKLLPAIIIRDNLQQNIVEGRKLGNWILLIYAISERWVSISCFRLVFTGESLFGSRIASTYPKEFKYHN